jgi:hypothetical protein
MSLNLNRNERILLHTILENRAVDLADYIHDTDYGAKHGAQDLAEAVFRADSQYLADIRALQSKILSSI